MEKYVILDQNNKIYTKCSSYPHNRRAEFENLSDSWLQVTLLDKKEALSFLNKLNKNKEKFRLVKVFIYL